MKNTFEAGPNIPAQEKPEISLSTEKLPDFKNLEPDEQKRIIVESLNKVDANEDGYFTAFGVSQVLKETYNLANEDYRISGQILSELEKEGRLERWPMGRGISYKIIEKN